MKNTKVIKVGDVLIGGGNDISIQSMTTTKTSDIENTNLQIKSLIDSGCQIIRLAITDESDAIAIKNLKSSVPLVADIHFDYKLAIMSCENGIDKVRINPGNIGKKENIEKLVSCVKAHKLPIRIGVNGGSIEKDVEASLGNTSDALVDSGIKNIRLLEKFGFDDIVISLKSSNVKTCVEAYRKMSSLVDYPLHLGITEAGTYNSSIYKSAVGIGSLLVDGIGDTLRVSITGDPVQEIGVAKGILKSLGILKNTVEVVACPTCGRCKINLLQVADQVEKAVLGINKSLTVAVMGCVVNGIGEGKHADIGLAGGDGKAVIFKKGEVLKTVDSCNMIEELLLEINKFKG